MFLDYKRNWEFTIYHDIMSACTNVSLNIAIFKFEDIQKYLKTSPTNP